MGHHVLSHSPAALWAARIALIAAKSIFNLEAIDLVGSPRYLGELTEQVWGRLRFEPWHGVKRLLEHMAPVELLARDEWNGLTSLPESLAAFVMPNHPAVERLLRGAANILGDWTGDPSLPWPASSKRRSRISTSHTSPPREPRN